MHWPVEDTAGRKSIEFIDVSSFSFHLLSRHPNTSNKSTRPGAVLKPSSAQAKSATSASQTSTSTSFLTCRSTRTSSP